MESFKQASPQLSNELHQQIAYLPNDSCTVLICLQNGTPANTVINVESTQYSLTEFHKKLPRGSVEN